MLMREGKRILGLGMSDWEKDGMGVDVVGAGLRKGIVMRWEKEE